jgi:hypothetical protein
MGAPMTRSTRLSGRAIQARSPACGTAIPAMQRASLCASRTNSACPATPSQGIAPAGIPSPKPSRPVSLRGGRRAVAHGREHVPRRPRRYVLPRLGRGPSPGHRESIPGAAQRDPRGTRQSPRRDGANDAAQVDLSFRHAANMRPTASKEVPRSPVGVPGSETRIQDRKSSSSSATPDAETDRRVGQESSSPAAEQPTIRAGLADAGLTASLVSTLRSDPEGGFGPTQRGSRFVRRHALGWDIALALNLAGSRSRGKNGPYRGIPDVDAKRVPAFPCTANGFLRKLLSAKHTVPKQSSEQ